MDGVIFDLDGTLIQTEKLKARSYARAAEELRPDAVDGEEVVEAYKELVGRSRREVATRLVERFGLASAAGKRMEAFGVETPWQAFVQVRLEYYREMLRDPDTLRRNRWPATVELLAGVDERGCRTGLATMSACDDARRVLDALDVAGRFDFVATSDDVENGKPDPEIYGLVLGELGLEARRTVVVEDSPAGVGAARRAGTVVVALATPFTRCRLLEEDALPPGRIVRDPRRLPERVFALLDGDGA